MDKASLSWRIASDARNVVQTAWQIEIASSKKSLEKGRADVWNSEKQLSDRQLNIVPEGVVFEPGKLYWWRVRVWNAADEVTPWSEPARFSVGPDTAYRWQADFSAGKGTFLLNGKPFVSKPQNCTIHASPRPIAVTDVFRVKLCHLRKINMIQQCQL